MIKYGSFEYFSLLELRKNINSLQLDKLGLDSLDKLRFEVDLKIKASEADYNEQIRLKSSKIYD